MATILTAPGLRERKKQRTREAIAAAAFEMFAEHGFDAVTVAGIARRAEVSEATVFNYFKAKEDLVYGALEDYETEMVGAIRDRAVGTPVISAFSAFLLKRQGLLGASDPASRERLAAVNRIIAGSPALLARERQIYDRYTRTLARVIAEDHGAGADDVESWVVANAIMGVQRGLVELVRSNVLRGKAGPGLARRVRAQAERALAVLERGLAGYP